VAKESLLQTIYNNGPDLYEQVVAQIRDGVNVNRVTKYSESALRVASNNGRFDVVKSLLEAGAKSSQLEWSEIHFQVAFGSIRELVEAVQQHPDCLETRDFWSRTPYLLAVLSGDTRKTKALRGLGADPNVVGRCGKTVFQYAIHNDDIEMMQWLLDQAYDPDGADDFMRTPLISAAEAGKTKCVGFLIEHGVDIYRADNIPERAIQVATNREIIDMLVEHGEDFNDVKDEMRMQIIGTGKIEIPQVSKETFERQKHRRFGTRNPAAVSYQFWLDMIQSEVSGYQASEKYDSANTGKLPPIWCYRRFGRTTNILPDGRIIEIGGEHEDHYDPDFCIYNDVVVFQPNGSIRIFLYPEEDFPPIDFHTATLVDDQILIVGGLGYAATREIGHTPVYRLDTRSMKIQRLETKGEPPRGINRHKTRLQNNQLILSGGNCWTQNDAKPEMKVNTSEHILDLATLTWQGV
jgi:hypothetical protein